MITITLLASTTADNIVLFVIRTLQFFQHEKFRKKSKSPNLWELRNCKKIKTELKVAIIFLQSVVQKKSQDCNSELRYNYFITRNCKIYNWKCGGNKLPYSDDPLFFRSSTSAQSPRAPLLETLHCGVLRGFVGGRAWVRAGGRQRMSFSTQCCFDSLWVPIGENALLGLQLMTFSHECRNKHEPYQFLPLWELLICTMFQQWSSLHLIALGGWLPVLITHNYSKASFVLPTCITERPDCSHQISRRRAANWQRVSFLPRAACARVIFTLARGQEISALSI